jgi:hypothetical protein
MSCSAAGAHPWPLPTRHNKSKKGNSLKQSPAWKKRLVFRSSPMSLRYLVVLTDCQAERQSTGDHWTALWHCPSKGTFLGLTSPSSTQALATCLSYFSGLKACISCYVSVLVTRTDHGALAGARVISAPRLPLPQGCPTANANNPAPTGIATNCFPPTSYVIAVE